MENGLKLRIPLASHSKEETVSNGYRTGYNPDCLFVYLTPPFSCVFYRLMEKLTSCGWCKVAVNSFTGSIWLIFRNTEETATK